MIEKQQSDYYAKYPEDACNRLDRVFHHPRFDKIKISISSKKFQNLENYIVSDSMRYGVTASGKESGKISFINTENLERDGTIDLEGVRYVDTATPDKILSGGDVLFSRSRLVGVCSVVSENCIGSTFGSYIIGFKIKTDKIFPMLLAKLINSRLGQTQIEYIKTGSSGNNINIEQIKKIRIFCPKTLLEQKFILKSISSIESQISKTKSSIETMQKKVDQIMLTELDLPIPSVYHQEYFFKTGKDIRSPYFVLNFEDLRGRLNYLFYEQKTNLINLLKKHYSLTTLGEIVSTPIQRGKQPEYTETGIRVIKTVDLKNNRIDYDGCLRTSQEYYDKQPEAHVQKNDILVSSTGYGSLGKIDIYNIDEPAMIDGHISILRLKEKYDPYFLTYFLRSHLGKIQFEKWFTGSSGQIELQSDDLKNFIIPDDSSISKIKQQSIAKKITPCLDKIRKLENKEQYLREKSFEELEDLLQINNLDYN